MEHTGYIRIERKKIPFYLKDKKVHLIPDNPFASLMPGNIKEKEIVKGTTTDNREITFIGCRYNSCILIYKALIISDYNTGIYPEIIFSIFFTFTIPKNKFFITINIFPKSYITSSVKLPSI